MCGLKTDAVSNMWHIDMNILSYYADLVEDGTVSIAGNTLTLRNIVRGENGDNAVYQCVARNKHGSIWINYELAILSAFGKTCAISAPEISTMCSNCSAHSR